jgi:hypothetical protein
MKSIIFLLILFEEDLDVRKKVYIPDRQDRELPMLAEGVEQLGIGPDFDVRDWLGTDLDGHSESSPLSCAERTKFEGPPDFRV